MTKRYDAIKRGIDIAASAVGLIVTAPIQVGVAAAVLRYHGRPVLFRQQRPGKGGELFELLKFRTMLPETPERKTDAERLTSLGRALRATSLDELPSLWNVLKGDMSLVGPRPLLPHYLELYSPTQARRHEVRPGVTGLAQVRGRNHLDWDERFAADVEYVDSRSLALDLRILIDTVLVVFRRSGIAAEGSATMPEFQGSEASWPS
ncbi:MAG: sugar transferase [Propionibacteriaceae bacterium]|nr:sugar transferase [Propionibacteriaceae bacterium]